MIHRATVASVMPTVDEVLAEVRRIAEQETCPETRCLCVDDCEYPECKRANAAVESWWMGLALNEEVGP